MRPLQGVRRGGRLPHLCGHQGRGQAGGDHRPDLQELRRHQPGGHRRPPLLRGGAPPEGGVRHPRVPRRPARHRHRGGRRPAQRHAGDRQADGADEIVINGAGAAGIAIGKLLISMGFGNIVMCDINGIICEGDEGLNAGQEESPTSPTGITSTAPWPTPCGGRTPSWACPGPTW